ncbi:MAG: 4'-phosphopantetheinyl transferase superfamily protein [Muribaculaceae bacterium]|nr:4'-phosphopantetheinyl transferase superfamily protein [Muribaculaceae bacterium]
MPVINHNIELKDIKLAFWLITETEQSLIDACISNNIDITFLSKFKCEEHRKEKLAVRLLIASITNGNFNLSYTQQGAPILENLNSAISITHATGIAAIAISSNKNIGIDIEKNGRNTIKLRYKFLNSNELESIAETDIGTNLSAWTAKEALFKAIPENEIDFAKHLHLIDPSDKQYDAYETRSEQQRQYNIVPFNISNYTGSIAIEK